MLKATRQLPSAAQGVASSSGGAAGNASAPTLQPHLRSAAPRHTLPKDSPAAKTDSKVGDLFDACALQSAARLIRKWQPETCFPATCALTGNEKAIVTRATRDARNHFSLTVSRVAGRAGALVNLRDVAAEYLGMPGRLASLLILPPDGPRTSPAGTSGDGTARAARAAGAPHAPGSPAKVPTVRAAGAAVSSTAARPPGSPAKSAATAPARDLATGVALATPGRVPHHDQVRAAPAWACGAFTVVALVHDDRRYFIGMGLPATPRDRTFDAELLQLRTGSVVVGFHEKWTDISRSLPSASAGAGGNGIDEDEKARKQVRVAAAAAPAARPSS